MQPQPQAAPESAPPKKTHVNVKEAAAELGATITSTRRWLHKYKLPSVKVGKREVWRWEDIEKLFNRLAGVSLITVKNFSALARHSIYHRVGLEDFFKGSW